MSRNVWRRGAERLQAFQGVAGGQDYLLAAVPAPLSLQVWVNGLRVGQLGAVQGAHLQLDCALPGDDVLVRYVAAAPC